MKPFHLLFLLLSFTVLYVQAQRRTTTTTTENSRAPTSRSPVRSRGRSRFTLTQEFKESHELSSTTEPTLKHISPRKRVSDLSISRETKSKPQSAKHNYEVQEIVNESPIDSFKRQSKPRVLTETIFEASTTSRSTSIEEISSTSESTKTSEGSLAEASSTEETYTAANSENIETPSAEFSLESQEISRTQPISTTAKTTQEPTKSSRRSNGRKTSTSEEVTTLSSRSRARSRTIESAPSSRATRTPKRKSESSTLLAEASRRGPSVFDAPQTELRSRPGRRIDSGSTERNTGRSSVTSTERTRSRSGRRLEALRPEKITLDIPKEQPSRTKSFPSRSSGGQIKNKDTTTPKSFPSRGGKFRARTTTPVIDEQKLEVLPLFEAEPKTVQPPTRSRYRTKERRDSENEVVTIRPSRRSGRTRSLKSEDPLEASSTETDIQFQKPEVSSQVTVSVESKTEASTRRRNPKIKESVVISEVSEVTSKKVVTRRKNTVTNDAGEKVKFIGKIVPRGKKKSDVKLNEVKRKSDDSEEVDESDNYPEPFKALIQAKKGKKESRPTATSSPSERLQSSSPTAAPVVVTSIVTSSSSASAEVTKEYHDLDNELVPRVAPTTFKPTTRPIRNRFL
ncbi:unnamed protein product [Callosobruchus maculatus]|uniref:Uncharacterized protein n=1 Tax=Callosobruchus maculatus TaxID=64391 RepID=A0A653BMV7_CALMS|nr:unnamed protein product [Callosobruchus maculatus]